MQTAISSVIRHNDELSWIDLLALPRVVLRTADRGGAKNRKKNADELANMPREANMLLGWHKQIPIQVSIEPASNRTTPFTKISQKKGAKIAHSMVH